MFERFTDRARRVMMRASQEAQRLNHEYIGTEHMLLALVKEGSGGGATVLRNLGVDMSKLDAEIDKLVMSGHHPPTTGKLPQTPRAKMAVTYAIEEARAMNHNYVGTEHLLLGLLRETEGIAAQVLTALGVNVDEARQEILQLHGGTDQDAATPTQVRLTKSMRDAMVLANQEAQRLNHEYIGTEDLLLGLAIESRGLAAATLKNLGIDPPKLRGEIQKLRCCASDTVTEGKLPITPRVKYVMTFATEEAQLQGREFVDTGLILLGLLRESEGIVTKLFTNLAVPVEAVRQEVLNLEAAGVKDVLEGPTVNVWQAPDGAARVEDLAVWQKADELARKVYEVTARFPKEELWGVASQLRKAAFPIPPGIAQAYHRQNKVETRWLLNAVLTSLAEVQYLLNFSLQLGHLGAEDHGALKQLADDLAAQLHTVHQSLGL